MRKHISVLASASAIATFAAVGSWAETPVLEAAPGSNVALEAADAAPAGPAMWRIADEDSEIWMLGTVHLLHPDLEWRRPEIDAAFAAAGTVYFEIPSDPAAQQAAAGDMMRLGANPPGVTLSSLLSDEGRARLDRVATAIGLASATLEPLKPWLASVILGVQLIVAEGGDPAAGVDQVLATEAAAAGKAIAYFETPGGQVAMLAGVPDDAQVKALEISLRQLEETPDLMTRMIESWRTGDLETLETLVVGGMAETPELYDALIVERNKAWVERIKAELAGSGVVFVAGGAGHFVGPDGVPALLEAEGVEVERR